MYDNDLQHYYLRARYYSPATGRFNRLDPFAGNNRDPQSLHKYLYAHCNPIMNVDPSGEFMFALGYLIGTLWTHAKLLYMRTRKSAIMWRYYERAKSIIKAVSAGAIIASALFSLFTGAGYPQGDINLSLPFGSAPHLELWPNVDITFFRSSGSKVVKIKTSFNRKPDPTTIDISPGSDYFRNLTFGTTIEIDLDNLLASNLSFDVSKSAPVIKKGPFEAGFTGSLSGSSFENAKVAAGFGVSFKPIIEVMSFNVDFPLFTIDKSGIEMGWGTPVWKWGKDQD